jgi:hypothetical protein
MNGLALALALVVSAPPAAPAAATVDGAAAFERVKKLEGSWKTDGKDGAVQYVAIRLVANGSAVLETTTAADRTSVTSVTVYALEGNELVATNHGTGGQSKLKASGNAGDALKFDGVTKDAKVSGLTFVIKDSKLRQEWQVREGGRDVKKSIDLLREYVDTLK